ncbi:hypothetical protein [Amycolatopsis cihanbeyliensis]|uniref:Uncharacterized protein n=1 Tax=Amycolatopsis cihanbeyliensis TaxID=1128664 RepID=A0A542DLU3_AMYCI|nr:hypothetical protein [Amycolatopsis cihanbeyliensis]TQJ04057.1 hypothetical protein FB471_3838 [Amycolatopsis cihanbeyliensis]
MSSTDEELDEELRRLFADERLGLRPRADAEQAILAGARRVRRRRVLLTSGGGTLAVALLATGTLLLGGESPTRNAAAPATTDESTSLAIEEPAPPPAPTVTSTAARTSEETTGGQRSRSSSPPAETPPAATGASPRFEGSTVAGTVLGPDGYGVFKLGMSTGEAEATGRLGESVRAEAEGCTLYGFTDEGRAASRLRISASSGLVGLYPGGPVRTPEGIGEGSTLAEVRDTYPALSGDQGSYSAPAGEGAVYRIGVDPDKRVVSRLALEAQPQPCAGRS